MITLGSKVRDRITGFEGVVTSESRFLTYSGRRYGVTAEQLFEGKVVDLVFDEDQLDLVNGASNGAMPADVAAVADAMYEYSSEMLKAHDSGEIFEIVMPTGASKITVEGRAGQTFTVRFQ